MTKNHFCSFACYGEWQKTHRIGQGRKRITVTCFTCGKKFEKQPNQETDHNFCSRECFAKWRASEDWSGENNPAWLGGHSGYRGPNWNRQSRAARLRDSNTCQVCGFANGDNLPVHHIKPYHLFSDYREANRLNNLITLCPTCHAAEEKKYWQEHPEDSENRTFPNNFLVKCQRCGSDFVPNSGASKFCPDCCTHICQHCGKEFFNRKISDRKPKYCSRDCRNAHIKKHPA